MEILIATFPKTKVLAKQVAKKLKSQFTEIQVKNFPDQESYVKLKFSPKNKTLIIFNTFDRDQNNRLIESILVAGIGKEYKAKKIIFVAPYFPYLRQDTHFEKYDSFSIKYIAQLTKIFDKIFIFDPHLQRIKKIKQISQNMTRLTTTKLIADYIKKNFKEDVIIAGPDKESKQWAQGVATYLNKKAVI